jgi:integrase
MFLKSKYKPHDIETVLDALTAERIDVYLLLDSFVSYLVDNLNLNPKTVSLYVAAVRSYFGYHDIDVTPSRFKRRVRMPKRLREDEEPIDSSDIRKILLSCPNRRLKSYLLVLASSGTRALETLAIRNMDCDFSTSPAKISIRKEYSKTRVARTIYISNEAADYLQKEWLPWKYTKRRGERLIVKSPDDLLFSKWNALKPEMMYATMLAEFTKVLKTVGLDGRKEGMKRKKITFHSFRRYVKTVTATQTNTDYSEWLLGHSKSPYWTMKESQRREIYKHQLMPFLTFLDYGALENSSRGIVSQLENKDKEIAFLLERDRKHEQEMNEMRNQMEHRFSQILAKIDVKKLK